MYHVYRNQAAALIHPFISSFYFLQFSTLKFFVTLFSGTVRPRRLKLGTHVDSGQMYRVYRNQAAASYLSLHFFIFLSLQLSTIKHFVTFFSGTVKSRRLKLGTHVDSRQVYRVYWNQAAAYSSLYFFIFFLSSYQTLKRFVTFFSGTVRPRRLKHGTHVDSGQMYRVSRNQAAAAAYLSIYFFIFLSNFQTLKVFVTFFSRTVRPRRLKLGIHVNNGQMYRVYRNQAAAFSSFSFFIFFLTNFQTLKIFITLLSGTVRPRRLKLGTHVDSGWMYSVYQNQAAAAYSSLYFFLQYSNIKNFRHTFLRNCEA